MWVATHRSARVLTVSEASKRDILRYFHVPESKITVIYNAIDERFNEEPAADEVMRVRERYQLNDPFILYAGNIKPHKNLERLIEAFHIIRRGELEHVKLLIIGDEISKYATLRRTVHRYKLHKHVRFFGFVPDATLAILYRLARVFVFPSLYEGFGLPPLEAMASGTPVITSNVSSLPEVVGEAAMLIDPYEPDAIAGAMRRVLTDNRLRDDMRERGLARVREFSWARSVRRVREIYDEVLAECIAVRCPLSAVRSPLSAGRGPARIKAPLSVEFANLGSRRADGRQRSADSGDRTADRGQRRAA